MEDDSMNEALMSHAGTMIFAIAPPIIAVIDAPGRTSHEHGGYSLDHVGRDGSAIVIFVGLVFAVLALVLASAACAAWIGNVGVMGCWLSAPLLLVLGYRRWVIPRL